MDSSIAGAERIDAVTSFLAQPEQSLASMLAVFQQDERTTAAQGDVPRVPTTLLQRVLESGGLDGYTSTEGGLCIPEASFEGMLRTFLHRQRLPNQAPKSFTNRQHPQSLDDELEEVMLDDAQPGNGHGSLLEAMLFDGGQAPHGAAGEEGNDDSAGAAWRCAARRAVFDNFVDDAMEDDAASNAAAQAPTSSSGQPIAERVTTCGQQSPQAHGHAEEHATPTKRASGEAEANHEDEDEGEGEGDDDDSGGLLLPDSTTNTSCGGLHGCTFATTPNTDAAMEGTEQGGVTASPPSRAHAGSEVLNKDGPWMRSLRDVVDQCDDGIVAFELDPTFDYESNILGTSRRI